MWNSIAVFDMTRPHDTNHKGLAGTIERRKDGLGHSPVPKLLSIYKTAKIRVVPQRISFLFAVAFMFRVDWQQVIEIRRARRSGGCDAFPLIFGNTGEAFVRNRSSQAGVDIERHHGDTVHPCEMEQRQ